MVECLCSRANTDVGILRSHEMCWWLHGITCYCDKFSMFCSKTFINADSKLL